MPGRFEAAGRPELHHVADVDEDAVGEDGGGGPGRALLVVIGGRWGWDDTDTGVGGESHHSSSSARVGEVYLGGRTCRPPMSCWKSKVMLPQSVWGLMRLCGAGVEGGRAG